MKIIDVSHKLPAPPNKRSITGIKDVVVHHGMTRHGLTGSNYLSYMDYHLSNLGWRTGGYAFGINTDGSILQGYGIDIKTNHVGNYNQACLGIVLAGDFRYEEPTAAQWLSLYWLLGEHLPKVLPNKFNIKGHQEIPGYSWKDCPSLDMNQIRRNVANYSDEVVTITIPKEDNSNMVLRKGDRGPDIRTLQEKLNELGYKAGIVDGSFGPTTELAVRSFQRATNIVSDGIAGPQTFAKIEALSRKVVVKKEVVSFTIGGRKYKIEEA